VRQVLSGQRCAWPTISLSVWAHHLQDVHDSQAKTTVGTLAYTAPEVSLRDQ
jgi:hypothetical protein